MVFLKEQKKKKKLKKQCETNFFLFFGFFFFLGNWNLDFPVLKTKTTKQPSALLITEDAKMIVH